MDRYNKEIEYYKTANIIQYIQQNVYDRDQTETVEQQRRLTQMLLEVEQPPTEEIQQEAEEDDIEEDATEEIDTNVVSSFYTCTLL